MINFVADFYKSKIYGCLEALSWEKPAAQFSPKPSSLPITLLSWKKPASLLMVALLAFLAMMALTAAGGELWANGVQSKQKADNNLSMLIKALHPDVDIASCEKEIKKIYPQSADAISSKDKSLLAKESKPAAYTDSVHKIYLTLKSQAGSAYADLYVYKVIFSASYKKYEMLIKTCAAVVFTIFGINIAHGLSKYLKSYGYDRAVLKRVLKFVPYVHPVFAIVPFFLPKAFLMSNGMRKSAYEKAYSELAKSSL